MLIKDAACVSLGISFLKRQCNAHRKNMRRTLKNLCLQKHNSIISTDLEFCCLLSGWDVKCTTCPINWYGYNGNHPRKTLETHTNDVIASAKKTLGLKPCAKIDSKAIKQAFRKRALDVHPDRVLKVEAKRVAEKEFKKVLRAQEILFSAL